MAEGWAGLPQGRGSEQGPEQQGCALGLHRQGRYSALGGDSRFVLDGPKEPPRPGDIQPHWSASELGGGVPCLTRQSTLIFSVVCKTKHRYRRSHKAHVRRSVSYYKADIL